mgnify:CR=1 FL=1|tara:strand:+ start:82 stop:636 length:555 start_codon:yes stop_codon:yes gene_type:complete
MSKKFDVIVETALRRYQGVNFLIGDRVKTIDNIERHDWWKSQPALKLERLKEMIDSGDNLRVSAVKADRPATAQTGHFQDVDGFYVDIMREAAPGLFMSSQIFTLPDYLLEVQDDGINLAGDTPDSQRREDRSNIKPEEVSIEDNDLSPVKQTGTDEGDRDLPTTNVNIAQTKPAKSYTGKYLG